MELSVVILTKNEEKQIEECLESVRQLADETVVVDSGSSDKTLEIVKKYSDKIWFDASDDFSAKRNLGLAKASGDWVLYVDADERVTPELEEEIRSRIINYEVGNAVVYKISRRNFYFGSHEWPYIEKTER